MTTEEHDIIREAWKKRPPTQSVGDFDTELARKLGCSASVAGSARRGLGLRLDPRAPLPHLIAKRVEGLKDLDVTVLRAAARLTDIPNDALLAELESRGDPDELERHLEQGWRLDGEALDREMGRRGMSKAELAARAGVDTATVWRLRKQRRKPTLNTITSLARALQCAPITLLREPPRC